MLNTVYFVSFYSVKPQIFRACGALNTVYFVLFYSVKPNFFAPAARYIGISIDNSPPQAENFAVLHCKTGTKYGVFSAPQAENFAVLHCEIGTKYSVFSAPQAENFANLELGKMIKKTRKTRYKPK